MTVHPRRTQRVQEGGEGRAVVFGYTGLERIGEGGSVLKTIQHIEHAEAFAGIRWHGEHAHLHTGFQLLVCIRHVLRQRLLAGREKQQAPLLHLSARLSSSFAWALPVPLPSMHTVSLMMCRPPHMPVSSCTKMHLSVQRRWALGRYLARATNAPGAAHHRPRQRLSNRVVLPSEL